MERQLYNAERDARGWIAAELARGTPHHEIIQDLLIEPRFAAVFFHLDDEDEVQVKSLFAGNVFFITDESVRRAIDVRSLGKAADKSGFLAQLPRGGRLWRLADQALTTWRQPHPETSVLNQ